MKTFKSFCYVNNHKVFLSVDGIPYRSLVHSHLSDPFRDLKICMFFFFPSGFICCLLIFPFFLRFFLFLAPDVSHVDTGSLIYCSVLKEVFL